MNLREAAQQALEALELAGMSHNVMLVGDPPQDAWKARGVYWKLAEAISTLRNALAQPEPRNQCGETCERAKLCAVCENGLAEPVCAKPVAWVLEEDDILVARKTEPFREEVAYRERWELPAWTPLYAAPQNKSTV